MVFGKDEVLAITCGRDGGKRLRKEGVVRFAGAKSRALVTKPEAKDFSASCEVVP
jgi:hypothetical protein